MTVRVSVSPCRMVDTLLGTVEPFGAVRTNAALASDALVTIIHMITSRANVGVQVVELTEEKVILSYEYDVAHMFKTLRTSGVDHYGWLYTIEVNPHDEDSDIHGIVDTVYALCSTYRDICSREVARMVAEKTNEAGRWELENLRAALEYYGTSQAWKGRELVSDYNDDIFNGQPWRTAYNALINRQVTSLPEAVAKVIARRERRNEPRPEYLGR